MCACASNERTIYNPEHLKADLSYTSSEREYCESECVTNVAVVQNRYFTTIYLAKDEWIFLNGSGPDGARLISISNLISFIKFYFIL